MNFQTRIAKYGFDESFYHIFIYIRSRKLKLNPIDLHNIKNYK